ncbi:retrovirus-related pol polyprotein from transposon TNT 1-94 [Tanacetum coccineum]
MEAAVEQCSVDKKCFEIQKKELFLENDRLLELIISQDIVHTVVNSLEVIDDYERRTFTINRTKCPMTRITSNPIVPHKDTSQTPDLGLLTSWNPTEIGDLLFQILHLPLVSVAGLPNRPLVLGLRMLQAYITGHRSQLINFVEKFLGTVRFVVQFCDSDLEAAFQKHTCFVCNLEGADLLTGSRDTNFPGYGIEDNGIEFVKQTLKSYYEDVEISHQTSVARTPQQNGVVERRNRTLVEAARTMLIFSKAPLYLWVEVVATLKPKADINIFIGYAPAKKASGPALHEITHRTISSGLVHNPPPSAPYVPPTKNDWDLLFQPMFDEYFKPPLSVVSLVLAAAAPRPADPTGTPLSTSVEQDALAASTSSTTQ